MDLRMDSRPVALITGSAIRVGRVIALHLATQGYRVWVCAHSSAAQAQSCREELGEAGLGVILGDLSDDQARRALCQRATDPQGPAQGRIDLVVNNAASFERGEFLSRRDEDLRRVLELNLIAPMSLARSLAPHLARSTSFASPASPATSPDSSVPPNAAGRPGPSIINILDLGAYAPALGFGDHCISKAALWQGTRVLALELAPQIRCNAIAPGTVILPPGPEYAPGSAYHDALLAQTPQQRIGDPEDVAKTVVFLAQSSHVTGQLIAVDGGRSLRPALL